MDLNALSPKSYGNLALNKFIDGKYKNKHRHSRWTRNQYFSDCPLGDDCWSPFGCICYKLRHHIPKRQKSVLSRQIHQLAKYDQYEYHEDDWSVDIESVAYKKRTILQNDMANEVYGDISNHLQSKFWFISVYLIYLLIL